MKIAVLAATALSLAIIGAPAIAGDKGYKHKHHSYKHHGKSRHHYRHRNHYSRHHRYNHRRHSSHGGYILGGLVLGGLINQAYHSSNYHHPSRVVHTTRVIRQPETVVHHTYDHEDKHEDKGELPNVQLLRDTEGRCFAITHNDKGEQVLNEIEQSICEA